MDEKTFLIVRDWQRKAEAAQARLNEVRALVKAWRDEAAKLDTHADDHVSIHYEDEYRASAETLRNCAEELARALGDDVDRGTTEAKEWGKITPPHENDFV